MVLKRLETIFDAPVGTEESDEAGIPGLMTMKKSLIL